MKKYCIFASIFGLILIISGAVLYGHYSTLGYDIFENNSYFDTSSPTVETEVTTYTEDVYPAIDEETTESHNNEFSSTDSAKIRSIDIEASAAKINFFTSHNDSVKVNTSGKGSNIISVDLDSDGSLSIDYGSSDIDFTDIKSIDLNSIINIVENVPEIDIYLPEGKQLEEVTIELASGEMTISDLNTEKIDISTAAGNLYMNRVNVYSEADIEIVAGEIYLSESSLTNLDIETVSGGDIYISDCKLLDETNIETVSGNTDIYNLIGDIDSYDFDITVVTGNIRVNGEQFIPSNPDAENRIAISKVTGDCYIEFAE